MAQILLLSESLQNAMPGLGLLSHEVSSLPDEASSIVRSPPVDITLIDARHHLAHARSLCQLVKSSALSPVLVVIEEAGLATMNESWQADDFVLADASPGSWRPACGCVLSLPERTHLSGRSVQVHSPSTKQRTRRRSADGC